MCSADAASLPRPGARGNLERQLCRHPRRRRRERRTNGCSAADAWQKDTLLGQEGFWALTLALEPDYDGPVSATLIRRPLRRERECAVLYLHGYVDYFFQAHLADYYQYTLAGGQTWQGVRLLCAGLAQVRAIAPASLQVSQFRQEPRRVLSRDHEGPDDDPRRGLSLRHPQRAFDGRIDGRTLLAGRKRKRRGRRRLSQQPVSRLQRSRHLGVRRRIARFIGKIAPHSSGNRPCHGGTPSAC